MPATSHLSRERWIAAALDALADGGMAAVAVEPLAARLGVTKGSFYWHFRDRDELLTAALQEWERTGTEELIKRLDQIADPRERLAEWARRVLGADKAQLVALHAAAPGAGGGKTKKPPLGPTRCIRCVGTSLDSPVGGRRCRTRAG